MRRQGCRLCAAEQAEEKPRRSLTVQGSMRRQAWRGVTELELTKTEFDLLELLMFNAGIVVSRDSIYERIWGYDFETSSKSLDVYIGYLRRKTEIGGAPRLIHTIRGVGYTVRAA